MSGSDRDEMIRTARLRALGISDVNGSSSASNEPEQKRPAIESRSVMSAEIYGDIKKIIFGQNVTVEDMSRWYAQGFQYCEEVGIEWGLKQGHGGPCGILASVQAEMIREMIFESSYCNGRNLPSLRRSEVDLVFATALGNILFRVSSDRRTPYVNIVSCQNKVDGDTISDELFVEHVNRDRTAVIDYIIKNMDMFRSDSGVILMLMSVILTRGIDVIQSDMDDEFNTMIGQFGHCSQGIIVLKIFRIIDFIIMYIYLFNALVVS